MLDKTTKNHILIQDLIFFLHKFIPKWLPETDSDSHWSNTNATLPEYK